MEQKVQVLVDNVADSARAVLDLIIGGDQTLAATPEREKVASEKMATATPGDNTKAEREDRATISPAKDAGRALSKDVGQLRRLVQAAITALRNAEIEDLQRTRGIPVVVAAQGGEGDDITARPIGKSSRPQDSSGGRKTTQVDRDASATDEDAAQLDHPQDSETFVRDAPAEGTRDSSDNLLGAAAPAKLTAEGTSYAAKQDGCSNQIPAAGRYEDSSEGKGRSDPWRASSRNHASSAGDMLAFGVVDQGSSASGDFEGCDYHRETVVDVG